MVCRVGMRRLLALGGRKFSIDAFMAGQSDGFYFDFTRTDRHYQEHTGPTLAATIGDAIGLALDQRAWNGAMLADVQAAQSNLISGAWSLSVSGTATATESPAGTLNLTGDGTNGAVADHSMTTTAGRAVLVEATLSASVFGYAGTTQGGVSILNGLSLSAGARAFYFAAAGATSWLRFFRGPASLAVISGISARQIPGYCALQSTGAAKPTRQAGGAKFDGSDDNLLTTYYAGSGSNFIVALVTIPASIPVAQVVIGAHGGGADRSFLSVNTSGFAYFGLGSLAGGAQVGTTDIRGTETVIGFSFDGSTARLFVGSSMEYSGAQSGSPTTTVPYRLGALNSSGTAFNFFAGSIKKIVAGREHLTLARYLQIRAALLA